MPLLVLPRLYLAKDNLAPCVLEDKIDFPYPPRIIVVKFETMGLELLRRDIFKDGPEVDAWPSVQNLDVGITHKARGTQKSWQK